MKKIFLVLIILGFLIAPALADRNVPTTKTYTSSTLIKRGDWKVYRADFIATANGGNFTICDSLTNEATGTNIKTEGSEATAYNGKPYDFSDNPLEGSTGLYLIVTSANVTISYE